MEYYGNSFSKLQSDTELQYWMLVKSGEVTDFAPMFLTHLHDPLSLVQNISFKDSPYSDELGDMLIKQLIASSFEEIIAYIDNNNYSLDVRTIPMFNSFYDGTYGICDYLSSVESANYVTAGTYFTSEYNQVPARQKYGEEHLKLGASLGLVALGKPSGSRVMVGVLTPLGKAALKIPRDSFNEVISKLILRIDLISYLIKEAATTTVKIQTPMEDLGMKQSTINRRTQSVKVLIKVLNESDSPILRERLSKIYW